MAANDGPARSDPESDEGNLSFPQYPRSTAGGPPSIVSSRMTDIASDDGAEGTAQDPGRSTLSSDGGASRPGTARTGISSNRTPVGSTWSQSQQLRRGLSGARRGSGTASISGSPRPPSSTGRSHVPSLTSHAFFHPMSSQKLQAQRAGTRPSAGSISRQQSPFQESPAEASTSASRQNTAGPVPVPVPVPMPMPIPPSRAGDDEPRPLSHGTDFTSNTSPTRGHYPTASLSESVRPLQKKTAQNKGLSVNTDAKGYKNSANLPTPRSFRSGFLLPSKTNQGGDNGSGRIMPGAEKLGSVASSPQHSPTTKTNPQSKSTKGTSRKEKIGKNYQYFEGSTVFCFGGRLQNTKDRPVNLATGLVVVIPGVLFFIFSAPWTWCNISPAIPIVLAYIFYICVSSFIHASALDPGVLPRRLHKNPPPDENEDPLRLGPPSTDWVLVKSAGGSAGAAMEVPVKYCKTCNLWRPPRAHHCRLCDSCIETVDHHCVWINNCVGRRNYRHFFTFIVTGTIGCLYIIAASLAQILVYMNRQGISFGEAIGHFPVPFALVFYCLVVMSYPAPLTVYHIYLMARGETTREFLSGRKLPVKDRYRPFTLGNWMLNWVAVLCRPKPPSYYQFKKSYRPGDQRLGDVKREKWIGHQDSMAQEGLEMHDVAPVTDLTKKLPRSDSERGVVSWTKSRLHTAAGS